MRERAGMAEVMLDARGLSCPLPILKARRALRDMRPGQTLEVLTNDPSAPENFRDFCVASMHELLECSNLEGNVYRFVIKHGGGD
jgi:tRNA 2-thiouridine synthesizing protein A